MVVVARSVSLSIFLILGVVGSSAAQSAQRCDAAAQDALWSVAKDTMGLFVVDAGRKIGGASSIVKFDEKGGLAFLNPVLGGFHPVSGFKEMACGKLEKWTVHALGDNERDLHPHIDLSDHFTHLLSDPPRGKPSTDTCPGCIFGEVTVPPEFDWFWRGPKTPPLHNGSNDCGPGAPTCREKTIEISTGADFCVYGPWVMEKSHGYWPEIHPAQVFWGQTPAYTELYLVDDVSQRFEQKRHFKWDYLAVPDSLPWSSRLDATIYQVVRIDPSKAATITWRDDKDRYVAKPSIDTGRGTLQLAAPTWANFSLESACPVENGTATQVVLSTRLSISEDQRWRGVKIIGTGTGIDYTRRTPLGAPGEKRQPTAQEADFGADVSVEWSDVRRLSSRTRVAASAPEWGVHELKTVWEGVARQRVVVSPVGLDQGRPSARRVQRARWTVQITDLNNLAVTPQRGYRLRLEHPRDVPTAAPDVTDVVATKNSFFALLVDFASNELEPRRFFFENLKANVRFELDDGQRTYSERVSLHAVVPNFLAAVSGYDLEARNGAFPAELAQMLARWLQSRDCSSGTVARLYTDLNEALSSRDALPPWFSIINPRLRLAGVARQVANLALADRSFSPAEFEQLVAAMNKYREACRAEEQLRP